MRTLRSFVARVWIVALAWSCIPAAASAQEPEPRFEITPFAAWRVGGEFSDAESSASVELRESGAFGIIVNGPVSPETQWEVFYARQSTEAEPKGTLPGVASVEIDVDYLQLGGTYVFDGERVRPFIALTIGATRFNPRPFSFRAKTFVSGSFGGGLKFNPARNLGVRLEARAYGTLVDSDNRLFCASDGGAGSCLILIEGKVLNQWEARAGLTFMFD